MSRSPREVAALWFEEIWNRKNAAMIDELASPDLQGEMEGNAGVVTREALKTYWAAMVNAIPDFHVTVLSIAADGPFATINWVVRGTHLGHGLGIPPSGKPVEFNGLTWFEVRNGQVVRGQDRWNRGEMIAGLMQVRMDDLVRSHGLTARQAQVALLLAERHTDKRIAADLGIRLNTARRHVQRVLRKLGVHSRQDVAAALELSVGSVLAEHGSDLKPSGPGSTLRD